MLGGLILGLIESGFLEVLKSEFMIWVFVIFWLDWLRIFWYLGDFKYVLFGGWDVVGGMCIIWFLLVLFLELFIGNIEDDKLVLIERRDVFSDLILLLGELVLRFLVELVGFVDGLRLLRVMNFCFLSCCVRGKDFWMFFGLLLVEILGFFLVIKNCFDFWFMFFNFFEGYFFSILGRDLVDLGNLSLFWIWCEII